MPARTLLVFGEPHGTAEAPSFVGDVACGLLRRGHSVVLGLEIPSTEQARLDSFVASRGTPGERAALLAGPFWHDVHDGRTSTAMVALLNQIRVYRSMGHNIRVIAFDAPKEDELFGSARDSSMASRLHRDWNTANDAIYVVLVGETHARLKVGAPWDSTFHPMANLLIARIAPRDIFGLRMRHQGGTAWQCREGTAPADSNACRAFSMRPNGGANSWTVVLSPEPGPDGWSGSWNVGPVSAALPAVFGPP